MPPRSTTADLNVKTGRRAQRLAVLAFALLLGPWVQATELAPGAPDTYVVRPGDTLWSIAGRFLREPWRWPEVWHANSDIRNPNKIYPGDVLRLTMVNGQPHISLERGGAVQTSYSGGMRVVKLSPRVRVESLTAEIPTIPISSIAPYLTQPYVADSDAIMNAPYVVGFPDEHIVAGLGDSFYVRRIDSTAHPHYEVLRPGDPYRDPDTNEILGYEAAFVANADLQRIGDPAKLQIVRSETEVAIGDRVMPAALEEPLTNFYPRPGPAGLRGRILAVLGGVSQVGRYDVVVINRGSSDKIEVGQVFEVFDGGNKERDQVLGGSDFDSDWRNQGPFSKEFWVGSDAKFQGFLHDEPGANEPLPPTVYFSKPDATYVQPYERSGLLMVFRTFDRVSFALVLEADRSMRIKDRIASPPA